MVDNARKTYWHDSLIVFARMSGWVAGPILVALFLGKWLDQKFGTTPIIFFSAVGLSFFASTFGIVKEALKYMSTIQKDLESKTNHERNTPTDNRT